MIQFLLAYLHYPDFVALFIKLFGIVLSLMYMLFVFVMSKQIEMLIKAIQIHDRGVLILAGKVQIILSIILFLYSILIL